MGDQHQYIINLHCSLMFESWPKQSELDEFCTFGHHLSTETEIHTSHQLNAKSTAKQGNTHQKVKSKK